MRNLFFLFSSLAFIIGCNNLNFDGVRERFRENFSGTLTLPGNIDPAGTNVFSFSLMGDTHVGLTATSFIDETLQAIQTAGDAFVVVAGDLTNLGKADEFNAFVGTFNGANIPFRAALGNHDLYFDGWNNFKRYIGRSIYSFDADNVHFAVVDSGNGTIGEAQLNWLRADLAATAQPLKIVISHYPPISGILDNLFKMASEEEAALFKSILHHHNVNYMIAGHYHGYREQRLGNTIYIVTGAVNTLLDPGNTKHFVRFTVNGNSISHQRIEL